MSGLNGQLSAAEATAGIIDGVRAFLGETDAGDDMTLMVLRVLDPAPGTDRIAVRDRSSTPTHRDPLAARPPA